MLEMYSEALKAVLYGAMAFGASGLFTVALKKHATLRTALETEYILQEKKTRDEENGMGVADPQQDHTTHGKIHTSTADMGPHYKAIRCS